MQQHGRGGVLGMAVFLTKNSQPQRTSPVKRGFWVVHKLLGEHIPAPPADVAALPAKETETERQDDPPTAGAAHRGRESCAAATSGSTRSGWRWRGSTRSARAAAKDLAGRPVDNVVQLAVGRRGRGVPEFLQYLRTNRTDDFSRRCATSSSATRWAARSVLSDQPLLEQMQTELRRDGNRFATLFETVVCSPQFRNQRCRDFSLARFRAATSRR